MRLKVEAKGFSAEVPAFSSLPALTMLNLLKQPTEVRFVVIRGIIRRSLKGKQRRIFDQLTLPELSDVIGQYIESSLKK